MHTQPFYVYYTGQPVLAAVNLHPQWKMDDFAEAKFYC